MVNKSLYVCATNQSTQTFNSLYTASFQVQILWALLSPCVNRAGHCLENSQKVSGRVDAGTFAAVALNMFRTKAHFMTI